MARTFASWSDASYLVQSKHKTASASSSLVLFRVAMSDHMFPITQMGEMCVSQMGVLSMLASSYKDFCPNLCSDSVSGASLCETGHGGNDTLVNALTRSS